MKTLNQIVAEVENWASSHLQVHSFGQGDIWEISPSSSKFTFPLMWVTVGQSDPREMEMVDQFNVLVCDLVDTGERNELDVLSDTRQILRDLVAWYRQQHSAAYIVEFQGSITPFTERFSERVSGHALTIRLRQPYDYDSCEIPLGTPIPAPPFCEPATFTLINTATPPATLDSGSIPSAGSETIVAPPVTVLRDGLPFAVVPSSDTVDVPSVPVPCADATVELNGVEMATIPSGLTENIEVRQSSGSTLVGSQQGQYWRIGDSDIEINGTQVASVKAEDGLDIPVIQDGSPVGSWNGTQWVIPSCASGASVILAISDTNPNVGDTITLTATASGFTATDYLFFARQGNDLFLIGETSTGVLNYTVDLLGTFIVFVQADDNTVGAFNVGGNSVTSESSTIIAGQQLWLHPTLSGIVINDYPDLSPFGRNGLLVNSPTVDTNPGGFVQLNGVDQFIEVGDTSAFSFIQNTLNFTIGVWVKFATITGRKFISANNTLDSGRGHFLTLETGNNYPLSGVNTRKLAMSIFRAGGSLNNRRVIYTNDNAINDTDWHYVTLKMAGLGTAQYYVDGVPLATFETGNYVMPTGDSNDNLRFGRLSTLNLFTEMSFGPIQFYDRALSPIELTSNFNADKDNYGF